MMDGLGFYRIGHWCVRHNVPLVPSFMQLLTRVVFASHVPSESHIGPGTMLAYGGIGVIVHPRAVIGRNTLVGPHVVIGGRSHHERVPVIGDDVYIGVGAKVLGPVSVGSGAVIGAGAVVIEDVLPNTVVAGVPSRVIRSGIDPRDYCDLPDAIRARKGRS